MVCSDCWAVCQAAGLSVFGSGVIIAKKFVCMQTELVLCIHWLLRSQQGIYRAKRAYF